MSARRYPNLLVMRSRLVDDFTGLWPLTRHFLEAVDADRDVPGPSQVIALTSAIDDLIREATMVAQLGFDHAINLTNIRVSVLPRINGTDFPIVLAWAGRGGASYVASPFRLPHLSSVDAEYAGFDAGGRVAYFGREADLPEEA